MELVFEKIHVPHKHSFITRKLQPGKHCTKIHSHKNYELNLITSGSGKRLVGNHISSFEEGDLVLMGPNLPHCWDILECKGQKPPTCIVIHFYEDIISSDFFNIPELFQVKELLKESNKGIYYRGDAALKVWPLMEALTEQTGIESYITLLQIFNTLLGAKEKEFLSFSSYSISFDKDLSRIDLVYQYVLKNIQKGVSQEEAASLLHMASGSFCRYFKKKTTTTFMQYVKRVRIGLAVRMLVETDKQVSQICYESGYNNVANFNHQFRCMMDKTPSEYRKQFQVHGIGKILQDV